MNRAQKRFGGPLELVEKKISTRLDSMVREFISQAPFVVLATSGEGGVCDASPKGGRPGFVKVIDDSHLVLPDIAGNNLFKSYGNLEVNPHVGLLFLVARWIRAPLFFVATGSMANIGGAASAPVVAGVYHPALAPVGLLMAVAGYVLGIYGALAAAWLLGQVGGA